MTTIAVLIPTHNEGEVIRASIQSVLDQTVKVDQILVVADNDTAGAQDIATSMGVDSIACNGGSKAKAQDAGLPHIWTDLVLPLDCDTILAPDYVEKVAARFDDQEATIAAGSVYTQRQDSMWSAARNLEYLQAWNLFRPIQEMTGSVVVCSGCCSIFRTDNLKAAGGFPKGTLTEDIDFSLQQHRAGKKVAWVRDAVCYADEPNTARMMRTQLKRWKSGHAQSVRANWAGVAKRRPLVALWVALQVYELLISPLVIALPILALTVGHAIWWHVLAYCVVGEALTFWAPVLYGCRRRGYSVAKVVRSYPAWFALKALNLEADFRYWLREFIAVPMGLCKPFATYELGH